MTDKDKPYDAIREMLRPAREADEARVLRGAALLNGEICPRCGAAKPADQSCPCFDNGCE